MKVLNKTTEIYEAFDGKQFVDKTECENYESKNMKEYVYGKLNHFDIEFPLTNDYDYTFTAFKINSEEEFDLLYHYLAEEYGDIYGIEDFRGSEYYVVEFSPSDWVEIILLKEIVKDWNETVKEIISKMMEAN